MCPINHGNRGDGDMGNVACPPFRSTWGRVMGYMGNGTHEHKGQGDGAHG